MIDLAPHGLDLLEMVLNDEWSELHALTQHRVQPYPVDDGAVLMGRLRSGALATLHVGYNCPDNFPRRVLEVVGTDARALAINTMGQTPGGTLTLTSAATGVETCIPLEDDRPPFLVQVETFADALLSGVAFAYTAGDDLRKFELLMGT